MIGYLQLVVTIGRVDISTVVVTMFGFGIAPVSLREKSYMFGDNKSVVDSFMTVHAKLQTSYNFILSSCS
jgi:hypothetical protein